MPKCHFMPLVSSSSCPTDTTVLQRFVYKSLPAPMPNSNHFLPTLRGSSSFQRREDQIMLGAAKQKPPKTSNDRDVALAQLDKEKKWSFIKAWEESEKNKANNKAQRELSAITAWENNKKASLEVKLKKTEEYLEKKKAEYAEKKRNKAAMIHKQAEEKRALVEARRGEEILKAEEMSAKFRATGQLPKKFMGCF
uniref:Remorin C-terminal domain-containing protein n=1 Tax=Kalanchoe fedtschenkoi TaxID=63787 RepID=A0A7N0SZD4_KALFE